MGRFVILNNVADLLPPSESLVKVCLSSMQAILDIIQ